MVKKYFVIDFDSTFIKLEGLEELFKISLQQNPKKSEIVKKISQLTTQGMEGKIGFAQSLEKRVKLLKAGREEINRTINVLNRNISPSVLKNKAFFRENKDRIFIISGGFKELIVPVVAPFGISEDHVLANQFVFTGKGQIRGFDKTNPLSQDGGKSKAVKALKLDGEVVVIGDGFTDFEIKQSGVAKQFYAYAENVSRPKVHQKADQILNNFNEFVAGQDQIQPFSFPKAKIQALLLENIDPGAVEIFEKEGYQVELMTRALTEDELIEKIPKIHLLGIRSKTKVTARVLQNAPKLMSVGAFCIGTDQMDLPALTEKGIAVFNAPFQNTRSVVELAIGEMIMLMRGIFAKSSLMHQGVWDKSAKNSNEIRGKKLGIIGYGKIGSQLSVLAEDIGMEVYVYDHSEKLALGNARKCKSLAELLKIADVISVHVSGDRKNTNIIGEKEFVQMKDGVIFLNLSRGFVVELPALEKYLRSGKIRGAALDVFPTEPKGKDDPFKSTLQGLTNVILTPHIAGSTAEAQKEIAQFVSGKLIDYVNTGNTYLSVNIPNIQLTAQKNSHRLLHLHQNVPGILAQINNILAEHKININGQYLKTNDQIGYVITDVDKKYDQKVLSELKTIPNTIRFRILY